MFWYVGPKTFVNFPKVTIICRCVFVCCVNCATETNVTSENWWENVRTEACEFQYPCQFYVILCLRSVFSVCINILRIYYCKINALRPCTASARARLSRSALCGVGAREKFQIKMVTKFLCSTGLGPRTFGLLQSTERFNECAAARFRRCGAAVDFVVFYLTTSF